MLRTKATIAMWGDSQALRLPVEMTRLMGILPNDEVVLEMQENILTISRSGIPKEGTIEYLFKDYSGERFDTELVNPSYPVGEEKW